MPSSALVLAGVAPLLALIAITGDGASWPLAGAVVAWLVLLAGASAGRPLRDRLRWVVPPSLRVAEYAGLLWLAALAGPSSVPAAFALLLAITYRHYDMVYRLRHRAMTPPRWLNRGALGLGGPAARRLRPGRRGARARRLLGRRRAPRGGRRGRERPRVGVGDAHPRAGRVRGRGGGRGVIGMVLAAGAGRRLAPYTETLPKTLVPVDGDRTILDIALGNLAAAGLDRVVVVTGYAAGAIEERRAALEERHGVALELVFNPKAEEWNNAYSLWCARDHFGEGVLLINGDTVHPPSVEEALLAARGPDIVLALDDAKALAEEEMKVHVSREGRMTRINKAIDPATAQGEYIGLALIEAAAARPLADALEATFTRDPQLYYEDGFQEFSDRGGHVGTAPIGAVDWAEVDDHRDLERAREIACRC